MPTSEGASGSKEAPVALSSLTEAAVEANTSRATFSNLDEASGMPKCNRAFARQQSCQSIHDAHSEDYDDDSFNNKSFTFLRSLGRRRSRDSDCSSARGAISQRGSGEDFNARRRGSRHLRNRQSCGDPSHRNTMSRAIDGAGSFFKQARCARPRARPPAAQPPSLSQEEKILAAEAAILASRSASRSASADLNGATMPGVVTAARGGGTGGRGGGTGGPSLGALPAPTPGAPAPASDRPATPHPARQADFEA